MGTLFFTTDVVATLYVTFFLRYISNDAATLIWIGFALNIGSVIAGYFCVESPQWLVSIGRKDEAIKRLKYIAKLNGVENFEIEDLRNETFETSEKQTE